MLWTYLVAGAAAFVLLLILFRLVWRVASRSSSAVAPPYSLVSRPYDDCRSTSAPPR